MERSTEKVVVNETSEILQNLRYERKFIYENTLPEDLIETEVLANSFCFREIFHLRTVNNIYYDDQSLSFYHQNVAGDEHRDKYRIRWYGDKFSEINKPTVEIKKKMGSVGDKISFKLPHFKYNIDDYPISEMEEKILTEIKKESQDELSLKLRQLSPSLYNSYERRYFLSDCEKFRITIDYNMRFYNPEFANYGASLAKLSETVLELKYNIGDDKEARVLSQELNARLSKNSKYVRGINSINHLEDL